MKTVDPAEKLRIDKYIKDMWHFDPAIPSTDYQYVGQFTGNWIDKIKDLSFNDDSKFDYNRNKQTFADEKLPDDVVSSKMGI